MKFQRTIYKNQSIYTNQSPYMAQPSYVNQTLITKLEGKKRSYFSVGGTFSGVLCFAIALSIFDYEGHVRENIIGYTVLILPFLFLIYLGIKNSKMISDIYRYNSIFANDSDGFVSIQELTHQTGKSSNDILKELEKLFRMNVFYGCTLYQQGNPGVALGNAFSGDAGTGFIVVKCSSCGGNNRARAGTHAVCEYCGSSFLAQ